MVEKQVPDSFLKKSRLSISLDHQSKVLYSLFLFYFQVECYRNILKQRCRLLAFILHKAFFKKRKERKIDLELVPLSLPRQDHKF